MDIQDTSETDMIVCEWYLGHVQHGDSTRGETYS